MKHSCRLPASVIILLLASAAAAAAEPRSGPAGSRMRLGFRVEYFSQEVEWEGAGEKPATDLNSALAAAVLELRVGRDSSVSLLVGYGSSDSSGLMFRALPFSIDYQGGSTGGLALGAEADFALATGRSIRVSARGEITACLGQSKKWDIPGLAVAGTVEGKPAWFRAKVGPMFAFGKEGGVRPYLFPFYHYVWGSFEMRESVQTLSGKETKDFSGRSQFGGAGGLDIPLSPGLKVRAEAAVYPGSGRVGYSAMLATLISF